MTTLSHRAVNRAYLARQLLLERHDLPVRDAIAHLCGMQTQVPTTPFTGLWSRLANFDPAALDTLLLDRRAVRLTAMRSTVHLMSAEDALAWWPLVQPVIARSVQGAWLKYIPGADLDAIESAARDILATQPRTTDQLGRDLQHLYPGFDPAPLAHAARSRVATVQVTPRGTWGATMAATQFSLESWLGQPLDPQPSIDAMVLRYLDAFGPASVRDAQAWCGLTGLKASFERLRPTLLTFRDPNNVELFDLPGAPRPGEDIDAPVRLIAEYDNLTLSHADRTRVISDARRKYLFTNNGIIPGMVLLDGNVAGSWRILREGSTAALAVQLFDAPSALECNGIEDEGASLLALHAPTSTHDIRIHH